MNERNVVSDRKSLRGLDSRSDNYRKSGDSPDSSSLNKDELRTVITHFVRGEKFCDGLIAEAIEYGTL